MGPKVFAEVCLSGHHLGPRDDCGWVGVRLVPEALKINFGFD